MVTVHGPKTINPTKEQGTEFHVALAEDAFSQRELDILVCLSHGKSSKKIADLLAITRRTVDTHVYQMTHKVGVRSRADLISFAEKYYDSEMLRVHYAKVLRACDFKTALQKTAQNLRGKQISCKLFCKNRTLLRKMTLSLKKCGIRVLYPTEMKSRQII